MRYLKIISIFMSNQLYGIFLNIVMYKYEDNPFKHINVIHLQEKARIGKLGQNSGIYIKFQGH